MVRYVVTGKTAVWLELRFKLNCIMWGWERQVGPDPRCLNYSVLESGSLMWRK